MMDQILTIMFRQYLYRSTKCTFVCRYLTWFEAFLTNLELSHPGATELIDNGAIAVARSLIPGSLSAVDKTAEETFMKFAKSSGKYEDHECNDPSLRIHIHM